jgi:iron complex transport system ATP-binding protein
MSLIEARDLAIEGRLKLTALGLKAGDLVGLVGPNGSGKTSLLHALALIPPATGEVRIAGQDPRGMHPHARQRLFSFLPASRDVIWPLKARDVIDLGLPPGSDWSGTAERFELDALLDRRMDRLSTGERSRVMMVRGIAPNPRVLLMDEPIANLDPYWQLVALDELRRLAAEQRKAVLFAIHDIRAALERCDRLLVMDGGRLVADTTATQFRTSDLMEEVFAVQLAKGQLKLPADRRSSP